MNPRFLAAALWTCAAVMAVLGTREVTGAARRRDLRQLVSALTAAAALTAVFANAGADLW